MWYEDNIHDDLLMIYVQHKKCWWNKKFDSKCNQHQILDLVWSYLFIHKICHEEAVKAGLKAVCVHIKVFITIIRITWLKVVGEWSRDWWRSRQRDGEPDWEDGWIGGWRWSAPEGLAWKEGLQTAAQGIERRRINERADVGLGENWMRGGSEGEAKEGKISHAEMKPTKGSREGWRDGARSEGGDRGIRGRGRHRQRLPQDFR